MTDTRSLWNLTLEMGRPEILSMRWKFIIQTHSASELKGGLPIQQCNSKIIIYYFYHLLHVFVAIAPLNINTEHYKFSTNK